MEDKRNFKYLSVYDGIVRDIESGVYPAGSQLPPEEDIASLYGVSRVTIRRVYALLKQNNLVYSIPKRGTFVNKKVELTNMEGTEQQPKKMIAFIMPMINESYGLKFLLSLEEELQKHDYLLSVYLTRGSQKNEEDAIRKYLSFGVDGIIINPMHGENYNSMIFKLIVDKFPFVLVDRYLKGIPSHLVTTDNVNAAKGLCNRLLDNGHTDISLMAITDPEATTTLDRIEGFYEAFQDRGLPFDKNLSFTRFDSVLPYTPGDSKCLNVLDNMMAHICAHPEVTAFFATEYKIVTYLYEALDRLGKKVPDDYSVVCFDSPPVSRYSVQTEHVLQREDKLGVMAAQLMLEVMEKPTSIQKKYIEADIVPGTSVGPCRKPDASDSKIAYLSSSQV